MLRLIFASKHLILILLFISLILGCTTPSPDDAKTINHTTDTSSNISPPATTSYHHPSPRSLSQAYDELPLIATYVNELNAIEDIFKTSDWDFEYISSVLITLEDNTITYSNDAYDPTDLVNLTDSVVHFSGSDGGTAGGEDWEIYYHLLSNAPTPTMIIAFARYRYVRNGLEEIYEDQQEYEKQLEQTQQALMNKGIEQKSALDIATKMLIREGEDPEYGNYYGDLDQHDFYLMAWQKKDNKWSNTTPEFFDNHLATTLQQHLPFVKIQAKSTRLTFNEQDWLPLQAKVNQENFDFWQNADLHDWTIKVNQSNALELNYTDEKKLPLSWRLFDDKSSIRNLPAIRQVVHSPCPAIDFNTTDSYTFEGKIGTKHSIKMEVTLTPNKKGLELTGEYWYINKPNSKFPVQGILASQLDKESAFHRYKNKQQREYFACYFADCQLTGWWQHLGNYTIDKFTLQLVQ